MLCSSTGSISVDSLWSIRWQCYIYTYYIGPILSLTDKRYTTYTTYTTLYFIILYFIVDLLVV